MAMVFVRAVCCGSLELPTSKAVLEYKTRWQGHPTWPGLAPPPNANHSHSSLHRNCHLVSRTPLRPLPCRLPLPHHLRTHVRDLSQKPHKQRPFPAETLPPTSLLHPACSNDVPRFL